MADTKLWGRRTVMLALVPVIAIACAERTTVRTAPAGAMLSVSGQEIGRTPVVFSVPIREWNPPYRFRLTREGYQPVEGEFPLMFMTGRMVGTIATVGLLRLWRTPTTFADSYDFVMLPEGGRVSDIVPTVPTYGSVPELRVELDYLLKRGLISREEHQNATRELGNEVDE